jgi:hypothetical protein
MSGARAAAKAVLGSLPGTAEAYQRLLGNGSHPPGGYGLTRLQEALSEWAELGSAARLKSSQLPRKRILLLGYLSWWLEHSTALAVLLAAQGAEVTLGFIPYRKWTEPLAAFDVRRQRVKIRKVLHAARSLLHIEDLSRSSKQMLPVELETRLERLSHSDVHYTQQREYLNLDAGTEDAELLELRRSRNRAAAASALELLSRGEIEAVLIPNGSILEFGAIYQTARYLEVPAVTYEFGEQRGRIWLAQNSEVMLQDTDALWEARGAEALTDQQRAALEAMYRARRSGSRWANFAREWQTAPSEGAQIAAQKLGLDTTRPIALLCTNVVGDSLALNRQVFTKGMEDWLSWTVKHFAQAASTQLVVRVHPGEIMGAGHPSADIVRETLPSLPEQVRVVAPDSEVNTYDLIELADIGLVYTTTVGLEMAMAGVPVIVAGRTHFRGKGFTIDPESYEVYAQALDRLMASPESGRLGPDQRDLATRYAYRFFYEYPFAFPWHLIEFWEDVRAKPMQSVIGAEDQYRATLQALLGEPIDWAAQHD